MKKKYNKHRKHRVFIPIGKVPNIYKGQKSSDCCVVLKFPCKIASTGNRGVL